MKRRRETEKKGSEIRSAIEQLSNLIVLNSKTNTIAGNEEEEEDYNNITCAGNVITSTHVPVKPFLSICAFLLQILDKIGPTMAVLRQDIHHNMQRLENFYEKDPQLYSNIVEILKKEAKESCARKNNSGSKAFLWLVRRFVRRKIYNIENKSSYSCLQDFPLVFILLGGDLDFTVALLQAMVKDLGLSMEKAVEESYNTTLKQFHGWISSAAYRIALKLVPDSKTLITILAAKDEDNETLKEEMDTLLYLLVPILREIHSILRDYELDKMKAL